MCPLDDSSMPHYTYLCQEHQKAWALNLNGFDVEEAKILRLSGKPQNAPEGWSQSLLRETLCLLFLREVAGKGGISFEGLDSLCCHRLPEQTESPLQPESHAWLQPEDLPIHSFPARQDT